MPVCSPSDFVTQIVDQPLVEDLDSGVIKDARRRQLRRRVGVTGATLASAIVLVGAFLLASCGATNTGAPARSRPPEPLPKLAGRVLTGPTGLLIVAHGNEGPPFILNVDRHTVDPVRGLGVPLGRATAQSPLVASLTPALGGVMAAVQHARSQTEFLIAPDGAVRHIATLATRAGDNTLGAREADATWVLTWPHRGPCTLRLAPGARPAVPVPCGSLAAQFVVIPRGGTVAYTADFDGDGRPESILESQKARVVFSGDRWLEFDWKDSERNVLPASGIVVAGAHPVLNEAELSLDAPEALKPGKQGDIVIRVQEPAPNRTVYTLSR